MRSPKNANQSDAVNKNKKLATLKRLSSLSENCNAVATTTTTKSQKNEEWRVESGEQRSVETKKSAGSDP